MCGIFGIVNSNNGSKAAISRLAKHSEQRGKDSSGIVYSSNGSYCVDRADFKITKLINRIDFSRTNFVMGHSRLITNGFLDNQPVVRDNVIVIHNGIIVNDDEAWSFTKRKRDLQIDTEIINAIAADCIDTSRIEEISKKVLEICTGVVACAVLLPTKGKLLLFSNNGSLYVGNLGSSIVFASESFILEELGCIEIQQVFDCLIIDVPQQDLQSINEHSETRDNLIPKFSNNSEEAKLLEYNCPELTRCKKCILPHTMPFINFDENGICNYCRNYSSKSKLKSKDELLTALEGYRRKVGRDCIVPFSGGRDSSYSLHLIVKELKLKPIAYTYDWGMVTDLGRRNISRMCAELEVENIIVAADITYKRKNIAKNLRAWLASPELGMLNILMAGDKHFFQHIKAVQHQTKISLNLWGFCPLETTHFKAGFLGMPPDFAEQKVYMTNKTYQLRYHYRRFLAMCRSPGYFNKSLYDTLSGEYYRSLSKKYDYFQIFDYWPWSEEKVDGTLAEYGWETAIDTSTTWRIGDGTAAFYNYVYYTVAGFSEHDTFRSNQIREGHISREQALDLVFKENLPRYENIKWYLDAVGMPFSDVIKAVNAIPKIYGEEYR